MSYKGIAAITADWSMRQRLTACAAEEAKPEPFDQWVTDRIWTIAASPGWAAAWDSAVASGNPNPGNDEAVISDAMILAVIQPLE